MPPPSGLPDQFVDFSFPLNGINVSTEYQLQPVQTTRVGLNVRGYEPQTLRCRGGSRNGLSKYVPLPVSGQVGQRVQLLDLIVDPQEANLLDNLNQTGTGSGYTSDPSSPIASGGNPIVGGGSPPSRIPIGGRIVRVGGGGAGLNRNVGVPVPPSAINLTAGTLTSGSGTNYQVLLVNGQSVMASPLSGTDNEVVGQGCAVAIVIIGGKYYFSPFLFQKNP